MFFKMSVLKKLMKNAYKGGCLVLGDSMEGYVIASGWWSIWINKEYTPKELKAAIIELCGELPFGEWFRASSSMGNQGMMPFEDSVHPVHLFNNSKEPVNITRILMTKGESLMRLLQNEETKEVSAISEVILNLIDEKTIKEEDGEYPPIGPITMDNGVFSWGNNICYLSVYPIKLLDEAKEDEKIQFFKELKELSVPV